MYSLVLEKSITTEEKCKSFLQSLCQNLLRKLPKGGFTDVLERLCDLNRRNRYCKGLFTERHSIGKDLLRKCNGLKTELDYYFHLGEDAFMGQKHGRLEVENCENLETLCNIFQRICNNTIADLCSKFKGLCYRRFHKDYEDRMLLKMIDAKLVYNERGEYQDCVDNLLDKCHCLISMGPSMVSSCFSVTETCQHYGEGSKTTCEYLDKYLGKFFSGEKLHITGYDQDVSRNNCSFFGVCVYYLEQCHNQTIKDHCDSIVKECSEKNDPDLQFMSKVDLGDCGLVFDDFNLTWYFSGEKENGILCPHKDPYLTPLLIYASSLKTSSSTLKEKCKKVLKYDCSSHGHVFPNLDAYCKSNRTDECDNMDTEVPKMCTNLNATFKELGFNSSEDVWAVLWNSTANKITEPQCLMLIEECFYLGYVCSGIKDICNNIKALCYTVGTKRSNLNDFWRKLKESSTLDLSVFTTEDELSARSSVYQSILNVCAKFGTTNEVLFRWCLCPVPNTPPPPPHTSLGDLFNRLFHDFSWRYKDLVWVFKYTHGNRTLTECAYYLSECSGLSGIFKDLTHNCTILEKACFYDYELKKRTLIKST
ncbi:hypothetical protein PMAC_002783 [Pneumocystis sp. 'macacae']|nr:hypothetical protein PMAC_002783 [Pneumocystis sp. 'macacae']